MFEASCAVVVNFAMAVRIRNKVVQKSLGDVCGKVDEAYHKGQWEMFESVIDVGLSLSAAKQCSS